MTAQDILGTLKKLGKPQTAAIYKRHGAEHVFGQPRAAMPRDALEDGNAEARVLALQVADPAKLTRAAPQLIRTGRSASLPAICPGSWLAVRLPGRRCAPG